MSDDDKPDDKPPRSAAGRPEARQGAGGPRDGGQPPRKKRRKKKKKSAQAREPLKFEQTPLANLRRLFAACQRCGYFLSGYQALHGLAHLEQVAALEEDVLVLNWNQETRLLLYKTFGGSIDREVSFYSVQCPVCRRGYEMELFEEGNEFRVELKPRVPR